MNFRVDYRFGFNQMLFDFGLVDAHNSTKIDDKIKEIEIVFDLILIKVNPELFCVCINTSLKLTFRSTFMNPWCY